eukprot:c18292_g1_i2.p1 GENE.c18292_g1_i2~~c18292_g1_i2.p1  ORF type:complete len:634 (-),score=218.06 c18292_g1_i2:128-2029(-)
MSVLREINIRKALDENDRGHPESLNRLIYSMNDSSTSAADCTKIFVLSCDCAAEIHSKKKSRVCQQFIDALFGQSCKRWMCKLQKEKIIENTNGTNETTKKTNDVGLAYSELVLTLVSLDASYVNVACRMIASCLVPESPTQTEEDFELVYILSTKLCRLFPTSVEVLGTHVRSFFPHHSTFSWKLQMYLKNCLRITQNNLGLLSFVMETAVTRIISLDVEIKLDQFEESQQDSVIFELEETHIDNSSSDHFSAMRAALKRQQQEIVELASKLDLMMLEMFIFFERIIVESSNQKGKKDEKIIISPKVLFEELMLQFDRIICKTHRSKYTQFLIFYFCCRDVEFARTFLIHLHEGLEDKSNHHIHRMTMASYIASFVARCKVLKEQDVIASFSHLVGWLHQYLAEFKATHTEDIFPTLEVNAIYYSVCQAMMYFMCYHHELLANPSVEVAKEISISTEHCAYLKECHFEELLGAPFHPMQVCLVDVVEEFQQVMNPLGLIPPLPSSFSNTLKNAQSLRFQLQGDGSAARVNGTESLVEVYFPFDPYLLKNSSRFITPYFREWVRPGQESEVDVESEQGETSSSSEEDEDEEQNFRDMTSPTPSPSFSPMALSPMGISPDFTSDILKHLKKTMK